ncbi:MAG: gamma-glutamylcyclotransferase [Planctomycetia bacterium]|nr:gamma-glutamylcyclotransferase [Planctomycetia bacterium]
MTLVFAYGTLRRGERSHGMLADAVFAGEARTRPEFELADLGGHPALVEGGSTSVVGEAWQVDALTLARLDAFEDVPALFRRVTITLADGRAAEAYVMPASAAGTKRIPGGDWTRR